MSWARKHDASTYRTPQWGRGSKRRVTKIKVRGNGPRLGESLVWLALFLCWCFAQAWCVLEE